jgi:hypothetical protein
MTDPEGHARKRKIAMSTKNSLKYERDQTTGQLVHLYQEAFDEEHVCLEIEGFPFEAASSVELSGKGLPCITFQLPNAWARKLGLLEPVMKLGTALDSLLLFGMRRAWKDGVQACWVCE